MRLNATTLNLATMPPALPVSHLAHARSRKGEGAPDSGKPASVNLPADDDACLRWIAASEDVPLAEVARAAMNDYFAWRMGTPELAEQIAAIQPGIQRLYVSGYPADFVAHRGVLEAGVHFLQKPFTLQDLAAKVQEVLA